MYLRTYIRIIVVISDAPKRTETAVVTEFPRLISPPTGGTLGATMVARHRAMKLDAVENVAGTFSAAHDPERGEELRMKSKDEEHGQPFF